MHKRKLQLIIKLTWLSEALREHATRVFDALKENLARLPDEVMDEAGRVLFARRRLIARFRNLEELDAAAAVTRIHEDYHLGQVLRSRATTSFSPSKETRAPAGQAPR